MFDNVNIKAVIIVTAMAAILSVAAGGIGGVPMGILLLRALLFGILFGLGAIVINMLVSRFLPELTMAAYGESNDSDEAAAERGGNVDIVMGDETEDGVAQAVPVGPPGGNGDGEDVNLVEPENFQPAGPQTMTGGKPGALPDIGVFSTVEDDDEEGGEPSEMGDSEEPDTEFVRSRFADVQTNDSDKIEFFQNNTTAEELAKGVRTMLKSDEKG